MDLRQRNTGLYAVQFVKKEQRANSYAGVILPLAVQAIATIYRASIATSFSPVAIDALGSELHVCSADRIFGHLNTASPRIVPVRVTRIHKYVDSQVNELSNYIELCSVYYRMYKVCIRNTSCKSALCYSGLVLHIYFCYIHIGTAFHTVLIISCLLT